METRIFTKTSSLGDCQKKLKNDSPANEVETIFATNQIGISRSLRRFQIPILLLNFVFKIATPPLIFAKTLRNIAVDWFLEKNCLNVRINWINVFEEFQTFLLTRTAEITVPLCYQFGEI